MGVLSSIGRMLVVGLAFLAAALVSVLVVGTIGLERATQAIHGKGDASLLDLYELSRQALTLAASVTVLPALLAVIVGEVARIRSLVYYLLAGGIALAAIPVLARYGESTRIVLPAQLVWQTFATGGFAGGFVYWLIAGRRA